MTTFPFGRNIEDYKRLVEKGEIRFGTAIRIYNYAGSSQNEKFYAVAGDVLYIAGNPEPFKPEDILNPEAAPDGWSVEGYSFESIPDDVLKEFFAKQKSN